MDDFDSEVVLQMAFDRKVSDAIALAFGTILFAAILLCLARRSVPRSVRRSPVPGTARCSAATTTRMTSGASKSTAGTGKRRPRISASTSTPPPGTRRWRCGSTGSTARSRGPGRKSAGNGDVPSDHFLTSVVRSRPDTYMRFAKDRFWSVAQTVVVVFAGALIFNSSVLDLLRGPSLSGLTDSHMYVIRTVLALFAAVLGGLTGIAALRKFDKDKG
jgi:hypothetical protein